MATLTPTVRLDPGAGRSGARGARYRAALLFALVACLTVFPVLAGSKTSSGSGSVAVPLGTGSCGTAVIDGNAGEWDLAKDFYAAMYEAGDPTKPNAVVLSKLYLRWQGGVASILVLAAGSNTVDRAEAWVKFYDQGQSTIALTQFAWVTNAAGQTIGYEASFALTKPIVSAEVHVQITSGRTSSTGQKNKGTITLTPPACTQVPTYGLGNRVWKEVNGTPGYQPNVDQPVAGVTVELTGPFGGAAQATATTGADGCFLFDNRSAGDYALRIAAGTIAAGALNGYIPVVPAGSGNVDDNQDQNGTLQASGDVTTQVYTLGAGRQPTTVTGAACSSYSTTTPAANLNLSADFAFVPKPIVEVGIGNRVWKDTDGDGKYTQGKDLPLAGVALNLIDNDASRVVATATTDANGCYLVRGLKAGAYVVSIPAGQGVLAGLEAVPTAGDDETTDDDLDQNGVYYSDSADYETNVFNLSPGSQPIGESSSAACALAGRPDAAGVVLPDANLNETADFAFREPPPILEVALGNLVWIEKNGEPGYQPGADEPRSGVKLELYNETGARVGDAVQSDANGCYLFDQLPEGTYYVQIPASEFAPGGRLNGYSLLADPDGTGGPANSYGDDTTVDDDIDQNGRFQEAGTGNVVSNRFNLVHGAEPEGETGQPCGVNSGSSLPDRNVNQTADFSFEAKVALGNLVWIDLNRIAGYQAGVDQPQAGVTVELWNAATSSLVNTTTTDQDGFYLFDMLSPGQYYVVIPASQFSSAGPGPLFGTVSFADPVPAGGDNGVDDGNGLGGGDENGLDESSPELNGVRSAVFTLVAGAEPIAEAGAVKTPSPTMLPDDSVDLTLDFAFVEAGGGGSGLVSLGSTVWVDVNYNGKHDQGEPVIPGVEIEISGGGLPFPQVQATDEQGNYLFADLEEGDYTLRIYSSQLTGSGAVAKAVKDFYSARGISNTIAIKAMSTKDSLVSGDDLHRVDGDDDGGQAGGFGQDVETLAVVKLRVGQEPVNGTLAAFGEFQQTTGTVTPDHTESRGFERDDAEDDNGDMTVDFGFVHQCVSICDANGSGQVTQADIDTIRTRVLQFVPAGQAGTGDCDGSGRISNNDAFWCSSLIQQQAQQ